MIRFLTGPAMLAAMACSGAALADPVDDLLGGRVDPVTYDYGVLRDRPDAWLVEAEARVKRVILSRQGVAEGVAWDDAQFSRCFSEPELAMLNGVASARWVKTADEWRAARMEAGALEAKRQAFRRLLFDGGAAPHPELRGVERRLKASREATDPVVAELFRRVASEQFERMMIGSSARLFVAPGVSDAALDLYDAKVRGAICTADRSNREWLKGVIAERGWFRISRDGAQADNAAWLIAQHADHDPAFQQEVLTLLEKELAARDTSPTNYAYLYDRVAVNTGKLQRYGTQGRCSGPGDWRPAPVEGDPVARWRQEFDLDWPMADYIVRMSSLCR